MRGGTRVRGKPEKGERPVGRRAGSAPVPTAASKPVRRGI